MKIQTMNTNGTSHISIDDNYGHLSINRLDGETEKQAIMRHYDEAFRKAKRLQKNMSRLGDALDQIS